MKNINKALKKGWNDFVKYLAKHSHVTGHTELLHYFAEVPALQARLQEGVSASSSFYTSKPNRFDVIEDLIIATLSRDEVTLKVCDTNPMLLEPIQIGFDIPQELDGIEISAFGFTAKDGGKKIHQCHKAVVALAWNPKWLAETLAHGHSREFPMRIITAYPVVNAELK